MRTTGLILLAMLTCAPATRAQGTAPAPAATPAPAAAPSPALPAELAPAIEAVYQTSGSLKFDRWKRGTVRDEAGSNVNKILADVKNTLPPLEAEASAAPGSVRKLLPLARNIDALYDVVLRVGEAARVAAPDDQTNQLRSALAGLDKARLALADLTEQAAAAQEKQVVDLQASLKAAKAVVCPPPPPVVEPKCPAPPPPVRRKKKPATPPASTPAPANGAQPPATTPH